MKILVKQALPGTAPQLVGGRLIRIVDGTSVPQAGAAAKTTNKLWRIHSAFSLPAERFDHFELTDEKGGVTSGVKSGGFERIEFPGDLAPRPRTCWQPPAPIHQACRRARAYQGQALRVAAKDAASLDRPCARRPRDLAVGTEECSLAEGQTDE